MIRIEGSVVTLVFDVKNCRGELLLVFTLAKVYNSQGSALCASNYVPKLFENSRITPICEC